MVFFRMIMQSSRAVLFDNGYQEDAEWAHSVHPKIKLRHFMLFVEDTHFNELVSSD